MRSIGPDHDRFTIVPGSRPRPLITPRLVILADGQTILSSDATPAIATDARIQGVADKTLLTYAGWSPPNDSTVR